MISHINENGYLATADYRPLTLEDLALSYQPPVTAEQLEEALGLVQQLDPPGVGARDLKECLLLQLTPETPYRDVLRLLIQNHLEDIKHNRLPVIQKRTGFDLHAIKEAIEALKHLNPRPGSQFAAEQIHYVVPDILVERTEEGEYTVRLLDDWTPNIYISKRYSSCTAKRAAIPKTKEYLKRKIQAAQWLLESIEQRRSTLEKVTKAIIQHQRAFLDRGPEFIQPLKMQQIADQVGVHVTTVSRAVDDKWVQTPRGVFSAEALLRRRQAEPHRRGSRLGDDQAKAAGNHQSRRQERTRSPTKTWSASSPRPAIDVARRTVTKYRKMLDIPSSRERKDWTE